MTRLKHGIALTAAALAAFCLFEGMASLLLTLHTLVFHGERVLLERAHCRYDDTLGWVQLPNLDVPDLYGPGVYLRTNSRGFRGREEITDVVPAGWTRIVCSGDSFTLGYGVDDDHAWCHVLGDPVRRIQTVNMGQGGYGIDQAYLWYARDGATLHHQVQLLAFNTGDFLRMGSDSFYGYGRPLLRVVDDGLVVTNVPVPERAYYVPWLTQNVRTLAELRSFELLSRVFRRLQRRRAPGASDDELRAVASHIFATLRDVNRAKGSTLVVVYLPVGTSDELGVSEAWRDWTASETRRLGVPFIDLVAAYRRLSADEAKRTFSPVHGHYSIAGNAWVARVLRERLPAVGAAALAPATGP